MTAFSPAQVRRYARHVLLPDVGGTGQARLLAACVAVDLGGAAARVAATYLVAAGVGRVWLTGDDARAVALARFPLVPADLGQPIGAAMRTALAGRNPDVTVGLGPPPAGTVPLVIPDDTDDLPLAEAFARGGAAAALMVHRLATGGPS